MKYYFCLSIIRQYVRHSDKSNEMSEKIKIELALVYYCPVHDQSDIFSILPIDKLVDFLWFFKAGLAIKKYRQKSLHSRILHENSFSDISSIFSERLTYVICWHKFRPGLRPTGTMECPIKAHPRKILKLNKSTVLVLQMKAKLEKPHNTLI